MADVKFEMSVECSECGDELKATFNEAFGSRIANLDVKPCTTCIEKAREEADKEGYERGLEAAQPKT